MRKLHWVMMLLWFSFFVSEYRYATIEKHYINNPSTIGGILIKKEKRP